MRHGFDARRQPQQHPPRAGSGRRLRLARPVEDDECAGLRSRAQLFLRLVVAVEDDLLAGNLRRARERELAERGDVRAGAFLREQPQQRDVRERLGPVDDERARSGLAVRTHLAPDRLLAVDEQRRPMLLREPRRGHAAERQLAAFDPRGCGK